MGAAVAALVGGCAAHSGVVAMGPDTFMVSRQAATGFPGLGSMKAELMAEGAAHCRAAGKQFKVVATRESQPPYVMGNFPRAEIEFVCLSPGDPELTRPRLERDADTIIRVR